VYRSWELDKCQILQCTGAGNWTKVRYNSVQELGTGQGQIIQCTGAGNWTRSDITMYRSWELDKCQILQFSQELGTGQRSDITVYRS
jgi:hypothetical protein